MPALVAGIDVFEANVPTTQTKQLQRVIPGRACWREPGISIGW